MCGWNFREVLNWRFFKENERRGKILLVSVVYVYDYMVYIKIFLFKFRESVNSYVYGYNGNLVYF